MKKSYSLLLVLALLLSFVSCSGDKTPNASLPDGASEESQTAENAGENFQPPEATTLQPDALPGNSLDTGMKEKLSPIEYSAYVDLFYNKNIKAYEGKRFTKDGVFAILKDAYNDKDRYYVWGYADKTKCCDYQWEFVFPDGVEIPEPGSYIRVKGVMTGSEEALDKFWLTEVELKVEKEFENAGFDMDMTTMSSTLVRVQVFSLLYHSDVFDGKTVRIFGRAFGPNTIQHPYYDKAWQMDFTDPASGVLPSTGQYLLLEGVFKGEDKSGKIETSKITLID